MFLVDRRARVRTRLLDRAGADERIVGAAITGSAARDAEDRWSDIDLYFGVADGSTVAETLADWSAWVYGELGALHHFDLRAGPATYRAFLLPGALEGRPRVRPGRRLRPAGGRRVPGRVRRGGADRLPPEVTAALRPALVTGLDPGELARALRAATDALLGELAATDPVVAGTLRRVLLDLAG